MDARRFGVGVIFCLGLLGLPVAVERHLSVEAVTAVVGQEVRESVGSMLAGTARTPDGKAMEGVAVSARAMDKTFTTTVFTDEQGEYFFPALAVGRHIVWAQATGYATARADVTLDATRQILQAFTLNTIEDVTPQLSGVEWLDALPVATKEDRRMKEIFQVNCTGCHTPSIALRDRFDERGWLTIIETMAGPPGPVPRRTRRERRGQGLVMDHHKAELAKYLVRVRGPASPPLTFKLLPRPTGDAARVVITAYEIPTGEAPNAPTWHPNELAWHNGSDWSEGPTSASHTGHHEMVHDTVVDANGNAWLSVGERQNAITDRTITKVNAQTGQVTAFRLFHADGVTVRGSYGIGRDLKGIFWFDCDGQLGRLDPMTETFELFTPPAGMGDGAHTTHDGDAYGKIWSVSEWGALQFDPETKKFRYFQNATVGEGMTYGATGDAEGNGWWTRFRMDRVVKADPKTGNVSEVFMQPPDRKDREALMTPADREFYETHGLGSWGGFFGPGSQGPRRLYADKRGDDVWVPNYVGNNLAKINIRTLEPEYYEVPVKGNPYFVVVDKNHNVWTALMTEDKVLKFDPKTEQWTVYRLPNNGCEARHITVDDVRGDIWVACARGSRVNRMQFRTAAQVMALKGEGK